MTFARPTLGIVVLAALIAFGAGYFVATGRSASPAPASVPEGEAAGLDQAAAAAISAPQGTPIPTSEPQSGATYASPGVVAGGRAIQSIWQLTELVVAGEGQAQSTGDGIRWDGYLLNGTARLTAGDAVPEGRFELTLSAFQPSRDLPGQVAGRWYLRGVWRITDPSATGEPTRRHRTGVVEGLIMAELSEDPRTLLEHPATFPAVLPMGPINGRWVRGGGTLALNGEQNSGLLDLVLDRRGAPLSN